MGLRWAFGGNWVYCLLLDKEEGYLHFHTPSSCIYVIAVTLKVYLCRKFLLCDGSIKCNGYRLLTFYIKCIIPQDFNFF